jgi:4-oxalocrotonate tautomerase
MPHIEIKCFPGRTEEQKKLCAERITEVVAESLGCNIICLM